MHDTHAHLEMLCQRLNILFDNREDVCSLPSDFKDLISKFNHQYLENHQWIIQPTVSIQNFRYVTTLFIDIPKIYFLLGAHPEIIDQNFDLLTYRHDLDRFYPTIERLMKEPKRRLVGIGEIGLDYYYTKNLEIISLQKDLFRHHIELAIGLDLPIEIHTREAWEDTFLILDEYPEIFGKFLIHCFTGNIDHLKEVLKRGGKVAFGGITTFQKTTDIQEAVVECPLDSYVLETDLPFLAPVPFRGKNCLPDMIDYTAQKVANLKKITKEEVWQHSLQNSQSLFGVCL